MKVEITWDRDVRGWRYWSGWWFQTIAERDRFLAWYRLRA